MLVYHNDMSNFITKMQKVILLISLLLSIPAVAVAETIIMECNSKYYKYEQSLLGSKKVSLREDADWKSWCEKNIIISDKGARCIKANEKEKIETKYNFSYYTEEDILNAITMLMDRWNYCRFNKSLPECAPNLGTSEERLKMIFDQMSDPDETVIKFDGCKFKPIFENDSLDGILYYDEPVDEYLDKHAPLLGDKKCLLDKQDVITDIIRFDNIETLDFLIGTRELKNENYKFRSSNFETTDVKEFIARYECNILN